MSITCASNMLRFSFSGFLSKILNFSGLMLTVTLSPTDRLCSLYDGNSPSPKKSMRQYSRLVTDATEPSKKLVSPIKDATNLVRGFS